MISDRLVEIASYSFPHEAHVARASLDAAGIRSWLTDEHTINMQWLYSNALGGVRLHVRRADAEAAREILETDYSSLLENEPWSVRETEMVCCRRCGSDVLEAHVAGRKPAFLVWLLLGLPLFFVRRGMRCTACGYFTRN